MKATKDRTSKEDKRKGIALGGPFSHQLHKHKPVFIKFGKVVVIKERKVWTGAKKRHGILSREHMPCILAFARSSGLKGSRNENFPVFLYSFKNKNLVLNQSVNSVTASDTNDETVGKQLTNMAIIRSCSPPRRTTSSFKVYSCLHMLAESHYWRLINCVELLVIGIQWSYVDGPLKKQPFDDALDG